MCNLEELKKCRVVKYANEYYLVENDALYWVNLVSGVKILVGDFIYSKVVCAYKTFNDYLNNKPYFISEDNLLSVKAKEWLRYIIGSMVNVDLDSFRLMVGFNYAKIIYDDIYGDEDFIALPKTKFVIFDFNNLEKNKEYTFKELGIKL